LLFMILLIEGVYALEGNHIISNSEKWQDAYSTLLFANLQGKDSDFLVSTPHGPILLGGIRKSETLGVITSRDKPFVFNYPELIKSKGFAGVDELVVRDANLELIQQDEMKDIKDFIVVGDSFGYSAIAVAPYAIRKRAWVFLADRTNIAEIDSILSNRNVQSLLIYGYVDRQVRETLQKYNPEIINTGDKFKDNIEIVKKFKDIQPTKQIILTNGEFIEKEVVSGMNPVLFTGRENVPEQIADYIKNSDITVGVLIGNELIGAATNIRRTTGISVMVKFARGSRTRNSAISTVEGLDLFYLPSPQLSLEMHSIKYNKALSQLEVTYKSNSNVPGYFKGTITITSENGEEKKVGDIESIFIAPGDFKTVVYSGIDISGEDLNAEVYTLYGETPSALDRVLRGTFDVGIVNVIDRCEIDILSLKYNKQKESFYVKIKNLANVDCWVDVELENVLINEIETTIGSKFPEKIKAGKTGYVMIEQRMDEKDLEDNEFIDLTAYYGERQDSLVKIFKGKFKLEIQTFPLLTYIIIILIILIVLLIIISFILRKKEEEF